MFGRGLVAFTVRIHNEYVLAGTFLICLNLKGS